MPIKDKVSEKKSTKRVKSKKKDNRELTSKQKKFCELVLLPSHTFTQAYKEAYDNDTMSNRAVYVECHRLLKNPKVALYLKELSEKAQEKFAYKAEDSFRKLNEIQEMALKSADFSPAITAEKLKGTLYGLHIDRKDITSKGKELGNTVFVSKEDTKKADDHIKEITQDN